MKTRVKNPLLPVLLTAILIFPGYVRSGPLDSWTSHTPAGTNVTLWGVAYGNGQFVVVGDGGTILTSSDGKQWLPREVETNAALVSEGFLTSTTEIAFSVIVYGNGKLVALGNSRQGMSIAATSTDGIAWSLSGPVFYDFRASGVVYGNGRFIAVGQETGPTTTIGSTDGVSWWGIWGYNLVTGPITYCRGQFVAAGVSRNSQGALENVGFLTSPDGTNWQAQAAGPSNQLFGVTYGKGQFVAVGDLGTIFSSPEGADWFPVWSGTSNALNDVVYGNGLFVAVSGWGSVVDMLPEAPVNGPILTSADGLSWTQRQPGTTTPLTRVAYGNGRFVAVGHHGTILVSDPIINLSMRPEASRQVSLSLEGPSGLNYTIQSSTDLKSWQTITNITTVQSTTTFATPFPPTAANAYYRAYSQ